MDFSNLTPDGTKTEAPETKSIDPALEAKLSQLPENLAVASIEKKVVDSVQILPEHQEFAIKEADSFDIKDTNSVLMFAFKAQKEYTESLKALLSDARVRDLGSGEMIIAKIRSGLEIAEVEKMKQELNPQGMKKSLMKLPGVGKLFSSFNDWETKKIKLQTLVQEVETSIHEQLESLVKENAKLDVMMEEVRNNFYQLGVYLYAGEEIVKRVTQEYADAREKAVESGNALEISDLLFLKGQIQSFDTRLLEIKKAYVSAPLEMQNILMTQQAARIEVQTQLNAMLFTVPNLIKSLVRLVSLFNIKEAQNVRDQHNELNKELAELAGSTLSEVATSAQGALIDAANEADQIQAQAEETLALAQKLADGSREIKAAQERADTTLVRVIDDFKETLLETNQKSL